VVEDYVPIAGTRLYLLPASFEPLALRALDGARRKGFFFFYPGVDSVRQLNDRQLKFIAIYDGNGTDSARKAGYKGSDNVLAQMARHLLRNTHIRKLITGRQERELNPQIANRQERQSFWTSTMKSQLVDIGDRLKASELLGRSEADFTENHRVGDPLGRPLPPTTIAVFKDLDKKALLKLAHGIGQ
jgi:hypothetical protein